jgi:ribosomal protein S18 acetylase RimI-like enzyme
VQSEAASVIHAKPISELVNSAYRGAAGRRGWTHEAELLAGERTRPSDVAAMIEDSSTTLLIRRSDDRHSLVGCVAIEMNGADRCTISMLAIAPERQTGGLGRSLLADAEHFAAEQGATVAKLTVVEQREELIAWYERHGYRRTGFHEAFPYGDDSVGTPLRDDLRFVILEKAL